MAEIVGVDTKTIVDMIAQRIKENRIRRRQYDSAYRRAYYAVNRDRIKEKENEMKAYYEELENRFDDLLEENKVLREQNKLLKAMLPRINQNVAIQ